MRLIKLCLLVVCVSCIVGTPGLAQNSSLSSAFHFSSQVSYLGATLSHDLVGLNRDKVKLRGTFSYLTGGYETRGFESQSADRFEIGLETKNTIVRGKGLFSVLGLAYVYSQVDEPGAATRDDGLMFAMGFGSRIASTVSVVAKYVGGRDNGVRFAMEVAF